MNTKPTTKPNELDIEFNLDNETSEQRMKNCDNDFNSIFHQFSLDKSYLVDCGYLTLKELMDVHHKRWDEHMRKYGSGKRIIKLHPSRMLQKDEPQQQETLTKEK